MKDLNNIELEKGAIYHILGSGSKPVIGRFKHETDCSIIFSKVDKTTPPKEVILYSWNRQLSKWKAINNCPVIRVEQQLIDRYDIK